MLEVGGGGVSDGGSDGVVVEVIVKVVVEVWAMWWRGGWEVMVCHPQNFFCQSNSGVGDILAKILSKTVQKGQNGFRRVQKGPICTKSSAEG